MTAETKQVKKEYYRLLTPAWQKTVQTWFDLMHGQHQDKGQKPSSGELARLKRVDSVAQIPLTDGFRRLWFALQRAGGEMKESDMIGWAIVAGILAHVKNDDPHTFAECAGQSPNERPAVHPLRFQQLLAARNADELYIRLKRQLPLIDHRCHVLRLTDDLLRWQRELKDEYVHRQNSIAVQWALKYYALIPEKTA